MTRKKRGRPRRSRTDWTVLLWVATVFFFAGLAFFVIFHNAWALALSMLGVAVFVITAWHDAHPERGGDVGRPDMTPWGMG